MLHREKLVKGPVEMVGQIGQLFVPPFIGITGYTSTGAINSPGSTSNSDLQLGQATRPMEEPPSLMLR